MYEGPATRVLTYVFVAWAVVRSLVQTLHFTVRPEIGETPPLVATLHLLEMAFVETPVTLRFHALDGKVTCGAAAKDTETATTSGAAWVFVGPVWPLSTIGRRSRNPCYPRLGLPNIGFTLKQLSW